MLSISNDPVILAAVQSIIQNMLASEDACQQPLLFLQTCGFGGLWRFAGPFTKVCWSSDCFGKKLNRQISYNNIFFLVQHDGGVIRVVCQLPWGHGWNVSIFGWRISGSATFATSLPLELQHEQPDPWFANRQRLIKEFTLHDLLPFRY